MIQPPDRDKQAEARRAMAEALAQMVPVTAALSHLYKTTHPSQYDLDREVFYQTLCDEINRLQNRPHCQCFGTIRFDADGSPDMDGYNVSSIIDHGGDRITVNIAACFSTNDYHVSLQQDGGRPIVRNPTFNNFEIELESGHRGMVTFAVFGELA